MAEEDFLIKLGLDPSGMTDGVRRAVNESLAEINRLQKAAGEGDPDARVAQLPNSARESLYSVDKSSTSELGKQKQIQQKMVEQRAKLIALAQQEAMVVARAAGKTASSDQLGKIRAGGESALATSLGLDKLTPAIKGQITKVINQINSQFAPLEALSGTALQNKFRQISNEILPTVGIQDKTRVRKATTIVAETDRGGIDSAVKAEEQAAERSAKAAESSARDAEQSDKTQRSARRRTEKALEREAKATERRASEAEKVSESRVNLTKAQVPRVQKIFGEDSAVLNSRGSAGVFKYNQADAPALKSQVEGLLGGGDLSAVETRALNAILEQLNRDLASMQQFSTAMEAENAKQLATERRISEATQAQERAKRRGADGQEYLSVADLTNPMSKDDDGVDKIRADIRAKEAESLAELQTQIALDEEQTRLEQEQIAQKRKGVGLLRQQNESIASQLQLTGRNRQQEELVQNRVLFGNAPEPEKVRPGTVPVDEPIQLKRKEKVQQLDFLAQELTIEDALSDQANVAQRSLAEDLEALAKKEINNSQLEATREELLAIERQKAADAFGATRLTASTPGGQASGNAFTQTYTLQNDISKTLYGSPEEAWIQFNEDLKYLNSLNLSQIEQERLREVAAEKAIANLAEERRRLAEFQAEKEKAQSAKSTSTQESLIPDQRPVKDINAETMSRLRALQEEYLETWKKSTAVQRAAHETRNKIYQIDKQIEATTNQERLAALKAVRAREQSIQDTLYNQSTKFGQILGDIREEAFRLPDIDESARYMPNYPVRDLWESQENTLERKAREQLGFTPTVKTKFDDEIEQDIARELSKQLTANKELTDLIETEVSIRRRAIANALVPDEVIPPKSGDLVVVPTQPRPVIDAVSDDRSAKRADNQRYATEVLRRAAEGSVGDVPIEMEQVSDTTRQIALAKEEELQDARELAAAAARYGAIIETELARQAAVAQQTTATMENAIPVTPAMLRNRVTGERTPTRDNYTVRRRMAEKEEFRAVEAEYGTDIAKQAKGLRDSEYDRGELQRVLDDATADFERKYVAGYRARIGAGSERIDPQTGRRSGVADDPLRELRKLVQDGLIGTLGAEWDFLRDDLQESFGRPGAPLTPRMKMFEDFSKKYNLAIDPGMLTGGTGLSDALTGDDMMVDMERLRNLQEQVRTSVLSQRPLADYADRIERFLLDEKADRQLPVTDIDADAARLNDARERAALASAPQTGFDDAEWRSVVGNAQRQMAEEWDAQVQTERNYTRSLQQRPGVAVPQQLPIQAVAEKQDAIQERTLTDSSSFSEEERALIGALINKTNALERQTLVLTSNYDDFKTAEEALIAALNRKARALGRQTSTLDTGDGIEVGGTSRPRPQPALRSPEDIADRDAEKLRNQKAADWIRQSTALIEGDEDSLKPAELAYFKALEQQAQATQQAANETVQQVALQQGVNDAYSGLQGSIEAMIRQNAKELAEWKSAVDSENLLKSQRQRFNATPRTADLNAYDALLAQSTASPTPAQMKAAQYRKPPTALGFMAGYENLGAPDAYEYLNPEKDAQMRLDLAIEKLEKAYLEQASLYEIITSGLADEFTDLLAAQSALTQRIKGMTNATIVDTPEFFNDYTQGAAEDKVARRQLSAGIEGAIAADPKLQQALLQADLELLGLKEQQAAQLAREIATNPKLLQQMVEGIIAREQQTAALERETMASTAAAAAVLESTTAKRQRRQQTEFDFLNTPEGEQFYINQGQLNERRRALREGQPEGGFGRFVGALGYKTQGASNPLGFFGGGALASLRYGLPSMLMYGAMGGVGNTFKEAEELQYNLARLEGQFESTFGDDLNANFDDVRANILGIAKDTGLAADEIANLQIQLTGAFGEEVIAGAGGLELVQSQVESASKLAQTVGLPLAEITDGLTAASLAFDENFERIGDVAVSLEQKSGVLAKETISFIGDIAPVAEEAGYSLEEFAAIAAVAQQRSGRSGAALAESFGRVIPALTEQKDKLMQLAAIEPALNNAEFIDSIRLSDPKAILDQIGQAYNAMSKEAQQATISLLGGRREAQAIIPAIANQAQIQEYTNTAEKSAGSLEDRFKRVRQTLTNNLQRLGESLRQLGVELLESGLTDVLESAIGLLRKLTGLMSPLLGIVKTINDAFGGWPVSILAAVAALKLAKAFLVTSTTDAATGAVTRNIIGTSLTAPSLAIGNGLGFRQNFRQGLISGGALPPYLTNGLSNRNIMSASGGPFAQTRAVGSGALTALGGGSAALGGAFIGLGALALLYGQVTNRIEADKEKIAEIRRRERSATGDLDLTDDLTRESRVNELETLSRSAERDVAGFKDDWKRFWDGLFNIQSEAAVYAIEAIRAGRNPDFTDVLTETSDSLKQKIIEQFGDVDTTVAAKDFGAAGFVNDIPVVGSIFENTVGRVFETIVPQFGTGQADSAAQEKAVKDLLSIDNIDKAQEEVLAALRSEDQIKELQKIVDTSENVDAVEQAAAALDNVAKELLTGDSRAARAYRFLTARRERANKALDELSNSKSISDLSELSKAYESGVITLEEYLTRSDTEIGNLQNSLRPGNTTVASEEERLAAAVAIRDGRQQQTKAILDAQEQQLRIGEALGAKSQDLDAIRVAQAKANLLNPKFTDQEARLDAALLLVQAEGRAQLEIARRSGDLQKVYDLINGGFEVPAETMSILLQETVQDDTGYKEFEMAYEKYLESSFGAILPAALSGTDSRGLSPDDLLGKVAGEVFGGGITEGTKSGLLNQITTTQSLLDNNQDLPDELRETFEKSVDYWVELLKMGGVATSEILNALSGGEYAKTLPGSAERQAIESKFAEILAGYGFDPAQIKAMVDAQNLADAKALEGSRADYFKAKGDQTGYIEALKAQRVINQPAADAARAKPVLERTKEDWEALKEEAEIDNEIKQAAKDAREAKNNYLATIERLSGDVIGALDIEIRGLQDALREALATGDEIAAYQFAGELASKQDERRKQVVAEANSLSQLNAGLAELNGQNVAAALFGIQEAQNNVNAARTTEERNSAQLALAQAYDALRRAQSDTRNRDFDVWAAFMEFEGNVAAAALTRLKQAQYNLSVAKPGDETAQAQIALMQAEKAYREAQNQERDATYGLLTSQTNNPVEQARLELQRAKEQLAGAKGLVEQANAQAAVNNAQKALNDAMNEARYSVFNLRQAELQAMGDDVGSAQLAAELARQQLQDAIKAGAGVSAVNNARASFISADKAAKDAVFQDRMDEYKWLLDMGRISKSQYINYLEGLKSTLIPGTKQFKDLELTIKQLKDDVGGDLQANLPTSLRLPTLYEVRRFDQTPQMGTGYAGIGYQDNRQVSINVEINDASQDTASIVVKTLEDALGTGRNGYGQRRF